VFSNTVDKKMPVAERNIMDGKWIVHLSIILGLIWHSNYSLSMPNDLLYLAAGVPTQTVTAGFEFIQSTAAGEAIFQLGDIKYLATVSQI
jgi:hypothetical protein